jgi:uncharacterized damage-inducible protein DinB
MTRARLRRRTATDPVRAELLRLVNEAYAGPAWHGPSLRGALRGALRGVTAEEAAWRQAPGRNSVWDLVLHTAFARHRVRGRLLPSARTPFPRRVPRDWWPMPDDEPGTLAQRWRRDLLLLDEQHRLFIDVVASIPMSRLREPAGHRRGTLRQQVSGIALHDVYHAGQIRLLLRSMPSRARA